MSQHIPNMQWFGSSGTLAAANAGTQLTLKPLRRGKLKRLIVSAGPGNPAVATVNDLLPSMTVTEVTIAGNDFIGVACPAVSFAAYSLMPQPWEGMEVDPSITITVTIASANLATLATAAAISAAFLAE